MCLNLHSANRPSLSSPLQKYPENVLQVVCPQKTLCRCGHIYNLPKAQRVYAFLSALIPEFWERRWNEVYPDMSQDVDSSIHPHLHMESNLPLRAVLKIPEAHSPHSPPLPCIWHLGSTLGLATTQCSRQLELTVWSLHYNPASALKPALDTTFLLLIPVHALTTSSQCSQIGTGNAFLSPWFWGTWQFSKRLSWGFQSAHSFKLPTCFLIFLGLARKHRLSSSSKKEIMHKMTFVRTKISYPVKWKE